MKNIDHNKLHDCYSPYSLQKIKIYHQFDHELSKLLVKLIIF